MKSLTLQKTTKNMSEEKYESIATKIAAEHKQRLDDILEAKGINYYQWFQMMAEITIRMNDDRHNLSPAMSKMIQLFQMIPGWKAPTTFLDPKQKPEVESAIYLVNTKGKNGLKVLMTQRGWFDGEWAETENVMDIVEHLLEASLPQSYKWLRQRMVAMGCARVFECILLLADEASSGTLESDIAEIFNDNDRGDFGQKPDMARTRQRKRVTVDDMQGLLAFDEHDAERERQRQEEYERQLQASEEASQWLREHSDFNPHGGEW